MSSFRIDRQYVTFEAVEMPVFTPGSEGLCSKNPTGAVVQKNVYNYPFELLEKLRKDAEEQARMILRNADSEADAILNSAKENAKNIIIEAQNSTEMIREEARQEGYATGRKEAEESAAKRKKKEAKELQKMTDELKSSYSKQIDNMLKDVISLTIEITKKIIGIKLDESDHVFQDLVNGAVGKLKNTGYVLIHVCPEDYNRYFGNDDAENFINADTKITILEEENYSKGDLLIESEIEALDLNLSKQIQRVEQAFASEGMH